VATSFVVASTHAKERALRSLTLHLPDAAATSRAGASLAPALSGGMVVTLQGDLGVGKTTLVRGMLRALDVRGAIKSPSYGLVEHYPLSSIYFYHLDFYRFADSSEWDTAGLAECFRDDSVCVIEWPERVHVRLPLVDLALSLALSLHDGRELTARAHTERGERCVSALAAAYQAQRATS
jgi:tRNA threonylcarbamoyladenosine biosynthesis protein TsaE